MRTVLLAFALLANGLAGCTPKSSYQIREEEAQALSAYRFISFDYAATDDDLVSVDVEIDPQRAIDTSHALTSAQSSTPVPPGTSPGQAAAGGLIATMMIASYNQRSAYDAVQTKTANLESALSERGAARIVGEAAKRAFAAFELFPQLDKPAIMPESSKQTLVALIEPKILFDNRLMRAKVKADIALSSAGSGVVVYKNSFEYWSAPVLTDAGERKRELYWSENQAERLITELNAGMAVIREAFERDLKPALARTQGVQPAYRTLGYEDGTGRYFIRGELLGQNDSRLLIRDLRGNIKSIYGRMPDHVQR